ncbi:alkaline phosphatase PafA [Roseivirga misakiensis]|uniref:Alkaline phosphatase n=1 Tax=Roseivirga misakiensis TaxID=1563681 RepID=A0A1E5T5B2_9BACT|nr:alkaline phosphatase PafA [Roseivirga misakiensis]OEK06574.1 alkaline phosphatase [Roseivirga misakiensis]
MKKSLFILCLFTIVIALKGQNDRPKLVVGIMVDQMKQEYIWRFQSDFGENGFKRLLKDGFSAQNGHYNYASTSTGPGHASVYTGTTPSVHGIVGNTWYSRLLNRTVYCAEDTSVVAVGGSARSGKISPMNLYSSTITDELKISTMQQGKVIAMSIKDRGSALPGGHYSDGSYWYDSRTGTFMTSSYYMDELPDWVVKFNQQKLANEYLNQTWDTYKPMAEYTESGVDNSPYERGFRGKETPTFPYDLSTLRAQNGNFGLLSSTPFGNKLLNEFAISAIDAENLGADAITDFLAVSFSSTDYIGHNFGPQSKEIQDTYIRLDKEIEKLLNTLDSKVGKGNYVVFLSADHAVAENSKRMKDDKFRVDNLNGRGYSEYLEKAVNEKYGEAEWFEGPMGYDLFLDHDVVAEKNVDLYEIQMFVARKAMAFEGIHLALTHTDLVRNSYNDKTRSLMQESFHPKESGDIKTILDPAWQRGGDKGTGHGNAWTLDTHVPIIFYGWGVKQGISVREMHITDIAPTLSMLLRIRVPNGAKGEPIFEAIK